MIYYSMIFRVTKIYFNKISLIVTCKLIKYILYSNNKILRKIRYVEKKVREINLTFDV